MMSFPEPPRSAAAAGRGHFTMFPRASQTARADDRELRPFAIWFVRIGLAFRFRRGMHDNSPRQATRTAMICRPIGS
jgi:hypothetical protein